jgi:aryl-alcohol dehydrogenase-like predicted oxidoreductase
VLRNPVVDAPIVGATKAHHLTDAVAALDIELDADEVAELESAYTPRRPTGMRRAGPPRRATAWRRGPGSPR